MLHFRHLKNELWLIPPLGCVLWNAGTKVWVRDGSLVRAIRRVGRTSMRKQSIMALAVVAMMASQASAADLPRKAASAPLPPPPPPYVWTGCYIGGNVGGAFAHIDVTNVFTGGSGSRTSEVQLCWWRSDRLRLPVLQFVGGRHSQHVRRDGHSPHQNICRPN